MINASFFVGNTKRRFTYGFFLLALTTFLLAPSLAFANNPLNFLFPDEFSLSTRSDKPFDIEITGEDFRYLMESALDGAPISQPPHDPNQDDRKRSEAFRQVLNQILPQVERVHLFGTSQDLRIEMDLSRKIEANFTPVSDTNWLQLYGLSVPKKVRMRLIYREPHLVLEPLTSARKFLTLKLRIPIFADKVYIHSVALDPIAADIDAFAGIIWDIFRVRKHFTYVKDKGPTHLSTDHPVQTLVRNIKPMVLPFLPSQWEED